MRSVININASVSNENLPVLSIPQEEIDVAGLSGIQFWPALESWASTVGNNGFKDKVSTGEHLTESSITVSEDIVESVDGGLAYLVKSPGKEIIASDFDGSSGITIGFLCSNHLGFGSVNPDDGMWFCLSHGNKMRWQIPHVNAGYGNYDNYNGPLLSETEMNIVLFVVDPKNGEAYLRVNGQKCDVHSIPSDTVIRNELMIGAVNANSRQMRNGHIRAAICFNRPLGNVGIEAVETYLSSLKV